MKPIAVSIPAQSVAQLRALWLSALALVLVLAQTLAAQARPDSFADLAEGVSPAVVNISTSTVVASRSGPQGVVPEGSPFEDFFREFQDRQNPGDQNRPRRSAALGAGFVISEDGPHSSYGRVHRDCDPRPEQMNHQQTRGLRGCKTGRFRPVCPPDRPACPR